MRPPGDRKRRARGGHLDAGVKGIYGPGTPIPASAKDVLEQIRVQQGFAKASGA